MLKLRNCVDFYVKTMSETLCPQDPTAFADDLLTYAATLRHCREQAMVVSSFCMLTGLEIAPVKMIARAIYPSSHDLQQPMELPLWLLNGTTVTVPVSTGTDHTDLLRYLGIYIEQEHTWNGQLSKLVDKVSETVRVLTHARASSVIKWCAISTSSYSALTYPAKYAPWTLDEYDRLLYPLRQILR